MSTSKKLCIRTPRPYVLVSGLMPFLKKYCITHHLTFDIGECRVRANAIVIHQKSSGILLYTDRVICGPTIEEFIRLYPDTGQHTEPATRHGSSVAWNRGNPFSVPEMWEEEAIPEHGYGEIPVLQGSVLTERDVTAAQTRPARLEPLTPPSGFSTTITTTSRVSRRNPI